MKTAKTPKNLKEMPYPPEKNKIKLYCNNKGKCPNFINFVRTPKTNNLKLWNERQTT